MKKILKPLFFLVVSVLVSCAQEIPVPTETEFGKSSSRYVVTDESLLAHPELLKYGELSEDDGLYWALYYLGTMKDVPMVAFNSVEHSKGHSYNNGMSVTHAEMKDQIFNRTLEINDTNYEEKSQTKIVSETVSCSTSSSTATEKSFSVKHSESVGAEVSADGFLLSAKTSAMVGVESEITIDVSTGAEVENAQETTNSQERAFINGHSLSTSKGIATSIGKSCTDSTTYVLNIDADDPSGYYRIALYCDCDIFLYVIYDAKNDEYDTKEILSPVDGNMFIRLNDYSPNLNFRSTSEKQLSINPEEFAVLFENIKILYSNASSTHSSPITEYEDGTAEHPYTISSPEDFIKIVGKGIEENMHFVLTQNIDFSGKSYLYSPIESFKGVLDGQNYTIKNYINTSLKTSEAGFFQKVSGTVRNLRFQNCFIKTDLSTSSNGQTAKCGIVTGDLCKNGLLKNVLVDGCRAEVRVGQYANKDFRAMAGAIAGHTEGESQITECGVANSKVYAFTCAGAPDWTKSQNGRAYGMVGGIVGNTEGTSIISNCYSYDNSLEIQAVGDLWFTIFNVAVYNCCNLYVGGLVGEGNDDNAKIENCVAYGNVFKDSTVTADSKGWYGVYASGHNYKQDSFIPEGGDKTNLTEDNTTITAGFDNTLWVLKDGVAVINTQWK